MKINKLMLGCALAIGLGCCCLLPTRRARAADEAVTVPPVIADGFHAWTKMQNSSYATDIWRRGGLLDDSPKPNLLASYFGRLDLTLGKFKNYEIVDGKAISPNSKIIYLAINFQHAAIYGRFLLYHADKDWVVQNMDFSAQPEAVMPWLAFAGENYSQ